MGFNYFKFKHITLNNIFLKFSPIASRNYIFTIKIEVIFIH